MLWPCEGGEKENGSQSRYQLPDSQNVFSSFSLISVQKCVKEGAEVAWVKYNIEAVVSREALREAYEVKMAFSLQNGEASSELESPSSIWGGIYETVPSVSGGHPVLDGRVQDTSSLCGHLQGNS